MSLSVVAAGVSVLVAGASPLPAFSLTASPAHIDAHPGSVVRVRIADTGSKPLTVRTSLLNVKGTKGLCGVTAGSVPGVSIRPAIISLRPHDFAYATVRISKRAPASDIAVIFASDPSKNGHVHIAGAVASQLVINGPHEATRAQACISGKPHGHAAAAPGPNWGQAGGLGGGLVALSALAFYLVRRARRRPLGGRRQPIVS